MNLHAFSVFTPRTRAGRRGRARSSSRCPSIRATTDVITRARRRARSGTRATPRCGSARAAGAPRACSRCPYPVRGDRRPLRRAEEPARAELPRVTARPGRRGRRGSRRLDRGSCCEPIDLRGGTRPTRRTSCSRLVPACRDRRHRPRSTAAREPCIADVRERGEAALLDQAERFDGVRTGRPSAFPPAELDEALDGARARRARRARGGDRPRARGERRAGAAARASPSSAPGAGRRAALAAGRPRRPLRARAARPSTRRASS